MKTSRAPHYPPPADRWNPVLYLALATDGDGTLLTHKRLAASTQKAIDRLRAYGRKLILVTGESESDVREFPHLDCFDTVVAENGAVLFDPVSRKARLLAKPAPASFLSALKRRLKPDSIGRVVISAKAEQREDLQALIAEHGLKWNLLNNRHSLMALPAGIDKAWGLKAALKELKLQASQVVGVGDAENDMALMQAAGLGVAVATAVPRAKQQADLVTRGGSGRGVVEIIEHMLAGTLAPPRSRRSKIA